MIATFRRKATFLLTCTPALLLLLTPAYFNGFPLVQSDSGAYLSSAMLGVVPYERPIWYSILLYALHWGRHLWLAVAAQGVVTVAVLSLFVRSAIGGLRGFDRAILLAAMAACTVLPLLVSEIMPDLFTPLLILSVVMLALYPDVLGKAERIFLHAVLLAGICVHQANWLIAFAVMLALLAVRRWVRADVVKVAVTTTVGVALLVLPNAIQFRSITVSPASSVVLLGKLMQDGIVLDYLNEACPSQRWSICGQAGDIREFHQRHPDLDVEEFFIWNAPLEEAGGWRKVAKYAWGIDRACLSRHPIRFALASFQQFGHQLIRVKSGKGFLRFSGETAVATALRTLFPERVYERFRNSLQETGDLHPEGLSNFHLAVLLLAAAIVAWLAKAVWHVDRRLAVTAGILIFAVAANGFVMGSLSAVSDRYQSRVAWLVVLTAAVFLGRLRLTSHGQAAGGRLHEFLVPSRFSLTAEDQQVVHAQLKAFVHGEIETTRCEDIGR